MSNQEKALSQKDENQKTEDQKPDPKSDIAKEIGGREGPEPTRYGDWEKNGIISDF